MKAQTNFLLFIFGIAWLYQPIMHTNAVGNNTAVFETLNPIFFPATDSNNSMYGFVYPKGGFIFEDATTSCTFNTAFPVSGTINMNGGTLHLLQDMVISNTVQLEGLGAIYGNNHTLYLPEMVTALPNLSLIKDLNIIFTHNIDLSSSVLVQGQCYFYGHNNLLNFNTGSRFVIDQNATLTLQNTRLDMNDNNNIECFDDTGNLTLNAVYIDLDSDWIFSHGDILFESNVEIAGPYTFAYNSPVPATIGDDATLLLDNNIIFSIGRATVGGPDPLIFYDAGSVLACGQCTVHITANGLQLTRGTVEILKNVITEIDSTDTATGLILGDNSSEINDITFYFGPGCVDTIASGALTYNNVNGNGFSSASPNSKVTLDIGSTLYMATTVTFPGNTLEFQFDGKNLPAVMLAPGTKVYVNNTTVVVPGVSNATYLAYSIDGYNFILDSNNSIYLNSGVDGSGVTVLNGGNTISGIGSIIAPITLESPASSLLLALQGTIEAPLSLNGGTLTFGSNMIFTAESFFPTDGIVNLQSNTMTINPPASHVISTPLTWSGSSGTILFTQDLTLSATRTFIGNVTLNGNGNTLNFVPGGALAVAPTSQLTLKDMVINGIGPNSMYCMDDTATITLDNVTWTQADDYSFDHGTLNYINSVLLSGPYTFTYSSLMPAIIGDNSTLTLNGNIRYVTGRSKVGGPDPLIFTTANSTLIGEQCSFIVTASGLALTRGQALLNGNIIVETESTDSATGLMFGNGIQADDITVYLGPGCLTELRTGIVTYNDVQSDGFKASSSNATFQLDTGATFYLVTTCTFPSNTFTAEFDGIHPPQIFLGPGAQLYFNNTRLLIPAFGDATYTGVIADNSGFVQLINNDSIYVTNGSLLLGTDVIDSGNVIAGSGSIDSPIIFTNSSSALQLNLLGQVNAPISLDGGTLTLANNIMLTQPNYFLTDGTIDLQSFTLTLGSAISAGGSFALTWSGNQGIINYTSDHEIHGNRTYVGNVTIDANGNSLTIAPGVSLVVAPYSTLTLKNMSLVGIGPDSIYCADNTGTIVLDNVNWTQYDNYSFDQGTLNIKNNVLLNGNGLVFTYASTQTCNILTGSNLILDNFFTFSCAPSDSSTMVLEGAGVTSQFTLKHATLYTYPGLQMTSGIFNFTNAPTIQALGEGLTFGADYGDITTSDMQMAFLDGTIPTIVSGTTINYSNANSNVLIVTPIEINFDVPNTTLNCYRTMSIALPSSIEFTLDSSNTLGTRHSACPAISSLNALVYGTPIPVDLCL